MSRTERRLLDISNLFVGGTGIVDGVMKYLMESPDEWAVVNHPWQPHVQHLHVLAAPLLVFTCGLFWSRHVVEKLCGNGSGGRATGLTLIVQFVPLVLSGYLIQVSVSQTWRTVWIWVHLITAGIWILTAVAHRLRTTASARTGAEPDS